MVIENATNSCYEFKTRRETPPIGLAKSMRILDHGAIVRVYAILSA